MAFDYDDIGHKTFIEVADPRRDGSAGGPKQ